MSGFVKVLRHGCVEAHSISNRNLMHNQRESGELNKQVYKYLEHFQLKEQMKKKNTQVGD